MGSSSIPSQANPKQAELDQEEVMRFVKSYYFSAGRYPTMKMVKQYTTLGHHVIINSTVAALEKQKKLIVDRTHKEAILSLA